MSQEDCYNFLKKHKGKMFSTREIAKKLKITRSNAYRALKRLLLDRAEIKMIQATASKEIKGFNKKGNWWKFE